MTEKKFAPSTTKEAPKDPLPIEILRIDRSGRYRVGPPTRPNIKHDNGFLGLYPRREPTASDHAALAYWIGKLELAEAGKPDLADATAAYRHFLFGKGKDRNFSYERYVKNDKNGAIALARILNDLKFHAEMISVNREEFELTSDPYFMKNSTSEYPGPDTENWQKAIGAHVGWVSAKLVVTTDASGKDHFEAHVILHIEDRYNFNPGQSDIATGIPDSANGRFEITGLAHQYMNFSTLSRTMNWVEGDYIDAKISSHDSTRDQTRRPSDNRRLRNRI